MKYRSTTTARSLSVTIGLRRHCFTGFNAVGMSSSRYGRLPRRSTVRSPTSKRPVSGIRFFERSAACG